jgi:HD-GYP domain-containing protein (c-di-GMP phosphodiesterase class II)
VALASHNLRRLLFTFEALADLGPTLTGESDFRANSEAMLRATLDAVGSREGVLFTFTEKPAMLRSAAVHGLAILPDPALIPLLPKHVYALARAPGPLVAAPEGWQQYLSTNGNVAPQLFHCIVALRVRNKLVGLVALGRAVDGGAYDAEAIEVLQLLSHYIALAVHNWLLTHSLESRISENLRLLASLNTFCDHALEAFAAAIDVKHVQIHGHSVRVGHYAAGIGEAMGLEASEVAGLRSAGYLHDIGKVAVDKRLFAKPDRLDEEEFREMADHTLVGHRIVAGVDFPWPQLPEVVRWHHERADGTGYPDRLHLDELPLQARIVAVADTFDAMISERPWRPAHDIGQALSEMVRITPQKFDVAAMQSLLIQVRRYAVDPNRNRFLDERVYCNISPADVDNLASELNHRVNQARSFQM